MEFRDYDKVIPITVPTPLHERGRFCRKISTKKFSNIVQRDLIEAVKRKDLEAFKFILDREGGDPFLHPRSGDNYRCSPYHTAAMIGCTEIVEYILDGCMDFRVFIDRREDDFRKTALHFAATNGCVATVRFLLLRGAHPSPKALDLWTPMHYAAENGHPEVIRLLLDHGANPNLRNETSQTPAHLAAIYVHPISFQVLVEHYGTLAQEWLRKTARAIRSSVPTLIPDTCRNIAAFAVTPTDLDIQDDWNKTPLEWAVENMSFLDGAAGESITAYVTEFLGVDGLNGDWFF